MSSRGFYDKSLACVTVLYKDLESPQRLLPSFLVPELHLLISKELEVFYVHFSVPFKWAAVPGDTRMDVVTL